MMFIFLFYPKKRNFRNKINDDAPAQNIYLPKMAFLDNISDIFVYIHYFRKKLRND